MPVLLALQCRWLRECFRYLSHLKHPQKIERRTSMSKTVKSRCVSVDRSMCKASSKARRIARPFVSTARQPSKTCARPVERTCIQPSSSVIRPCGVNHAGCEEALHGRDAWIAEFHLEQAGGFMKEIWLGAARALVWRDCKCSDFRPVGKPGCTGKDGIQQCFAEVFPSPRLHILHERLAVDELQNGIGIFPEMVQQVFLNFGSNVIDGLWRAGGPPIITKGGHGSLWGEDTGAPEGEVPVVSVIDHVRFVRTQIGEQCAGTRLVAAFCGC